MKLSNAKAIEQFLRENGPSLTGKVADALNIDSKLAYAHLWHLERRGKAYRRISVQRRGSRHLWEWYVDGGAQ